MSEDLDVADPSMPLSHSDFPEWLSWVADADPELLERMRQFEGSINGLSYESVIFGDAPALADEVPSIDEYVATR